MEININGTFVPVEQIKFAQLSTGYRVGLFRNLDPRGRFGGQYIVLVKSKGARDFCHVLRFHMLAGAVCCYIDYLARYA